MSVVRRSEEEGDIPIDETKKGKLRSWLEEKNVHPTCVSCGGSDWGAGEMVSAPILDAGGSHVREMHVPMVQLVCTNCGLVLTYAAVPMGLA
jgi:hypothetical protein